MGGTVTGALFGYVMLVDFECMPEEYVQVYEMLDSHSFFSDHDTV